MFNLQLASDKGHSCLNTTLGSFWTAYEMPYATTHAASRFRALVFKKRSRSQAGCAHADNDDGPDQRETTAAPPDETTRRDDNLVRREGGQRQLVLLIDDVRLTRECLAGQLQDSCQDLEFIAVASLKTMSASTGDPAPDIVLLNIHGNALSSSGPKEQVQYFRDHSVPLIAIVEHVDPAQAEEATKGGLSGIFPFDGSVSLLAAALRLVLAGGRFSPTMHQETASIDAYITSPGVTAKAEPVCNYNEEVRTALSERLEPKSVSSFTVREYQILNLLRRGLQNKNIAHELGISESTVKAHLGHIMRKLEAANRTEVVSLLIDQKLEISNDR